MFIPLVMDIMKSTIDVPFRCITQNLMSISYLFLHFQLLSVPMASLVSTSKAIGQMFKCNNGGKQLIRCLRSNSKVGNNNVQSRWFRTISSCQSIGISHDTHFSRIIQRRGFFGSGDGDEGDKGLSKVHEENCIMGYSPEQMYAVVAAVDMYQDFLPWCRRSDIVRRHPDGSIDAELEIGFKYLVESYVSHVKLVKPKLIKTSVSKSSLFHHLINIWEFSPGPVPGTCNLHFVVDFKFQSPLYSQVASMFFKEVVSRLVGSFSDRCRLIYGPGVPLHKS